MEKLVEGGNTHIEDSLVEGVHVERAAQSIQFLHMTAGELTDSPLR